MIWVPSTKPAALRLRAFVFSERGFGVAQCVGWCCAEIFAAR